MKFLFTLWLIFSSASLHAQEVCGNLYPITFSNFSPQTNFAFKHHAKLKKIVQMFFLDLANAENLPDIIQDGLLHPQRYYRSSFMHDLTFKQYLVQFHLRLAALEKTFLLLGPMDWQDSRLILKMFDFVFSDYLVAENYMDIARPIPSAAEILDAAKKLRAYPAQPPVERLLTGKKINILKSFRLVSEALSFDVSNSYLLSTEYFTEFWNKKILDLLAAPITANQLKNLWFQLHFVAFYDSAFPFLSETSIANSPLQRTFELTRLFIVENAAAKDSPSAQKELQEFLPYIGKIYFERKAFLTGLPKVRRAEFTTLFNLALEHFTVPQPRP